jgi:cytochrome c oxidase cbb3-type subunit I/II
MKQGSFVKEVEDKAAPLDKSDTRTEGYWHRWIESRPFKFTVLTLIAVLIGGIVELVPLFVIKSNVPSISSVKPYTPLEIDGRDLYIREGCLSCHSQLVRPFRSEVERYGDYSKAGEFVYDHPFLWSSKRTGPDLHRVGGKYPNAWHYSHMLEPTSMSPGSIMPPYPWLIDDELDVSIIEKKIIAMRKMGVPYPDDYEDLALEDLITQAEAISAELKEAGIEAGADREIIALIAYLQRLGTDIKIKQE